MLSQNWWELCISIKSFSIKSFIGLSRIKSLQIIARQNLQKYRRFYYLLIRLKKKRRKLARDAKEE